MGFLNELLGDPQSVTPSDASKRVLTARTPVIVYVVSTKGNDTILKAWMATPQERMDRDKFLGEAKIPNFTRGKVTQDQWVTSKEHQRIQSFPTEIRDALVTFDDTIRRKKKLK